MWCATGAYSAGKSAVVLLSYDVDNLGFRRLSMLARRRRIYVRVSLTCATVPLLPFVVASVVVVVAAAPLIGVVVVGS